MKRIARWWVAQRNSTRLAFILQIACRVLYSLFSLLWTPLLLGSMGRSLNGLFLNFQKIASLGVVGDLGMGGLVNIRASRLLGQEKENELRTFLATTRMGFVVIAGLTAAVFLAISPGLFKSLRFVGEPGLGSLAMLSVIGAAALFMVISNSYINNLNYGCGNIVWPIVPLFVLVQCAVFAHWLLALHHMPLWVQYSPYVANAVCVHMLGWLFVRLSHPSLARFWPLRFSRSEFVSLGTKSFWVYLSSVGTGIYLATDGFLISAGFGPAWVPVYQYNYRLCELAFFVAVSANAVSLPKLTQWLASADPRTRERGIQESFRLNKFQTFLGCCAAFVYLISNDWFVRWWLGRDFRVPLSWEVAFAANLALSAAGLMGSQLVSRCCEQGIRVSGVTSLGCALLNFALAFASMKAGSIFGIALATAVTLFAQNLIFGWYSSRQLNISWWQLCLKNWILALAFVALGLLAKTSASQAGGWGTACLVIASPFVFLLAAWLVGISLEDLRHEQRIFQSMIVRMKSAA